MAATWADPTTTWSDSGWAWDGTAIAVAPVGTHATSKPVVAGVRSRPAAFALSGGRYPNILTEDGRAIQTEAGEKLTMETVSYG